MKPGSQKTSASVLKSFLAFISVLLLASCSAPASETEGDVNVPQQESVTPAPEETNPEEIQPDIETTLCTQTVQAGIESTIKAQTASFAVEDFELAYSYSSDSFQASVSLQRFIEIIELSYGPLISSSTLSFENCVYLPESVASIDVRFTDGESLVYALRYVMVKSDQGWRVDGAGQLTEIGQGT